MIILLLITLACRPPNPKPPDSTPPKPNAECLKPQTLTSTEKTSAWIHTRAHNKTEIERFEVTGWPSVDFAIGIAPAASIDTTAPNGFFNLPTRHRFYVWRDSLYRHEKINGRITEGWLSKSIRIEKPCKLSIILSGDSIFYQYMQIALGAASIKEFGNSLAFEIAAYDTPNKGVAIVDTACVVLRAPSSQKIDTVRVLWDRHQEPKITFTVFQNKQTLGSTADTSMQAVVIDSATFQVTATDSAGNISAPSEAVKHKAKGKP